MKCPEMVADEMSVFIRRGIMPRSDLEQRRKEKMDHGISPTAMGADRENTKTVSKGKSEDFNMERGGRDDDATNEVYYAKLVDEENTKECLTTLKEVVQT